MSDGMGPEQRLSRVEPEEFEQFTRIVYVATSQWLLSPDDQPAFPVADDRRTRRAASTGPEMPIRQPNHEALINAIMARGQAGRAFLHHAVDEHAGHDGAPTGRQARWVEDPDEVVALTRKLTSNVSETWSSARERRLPRDPGHALIDLRHRIFMDEQRFDAVAELPHEVPYYVMLDLRFFHLFDQLRCHAGVTVWSHLPRHGWHRPPDIDNEAERRGLKAGIEVYHRSFPRVAKHVEKLLGQYLTEAEVRVHNRTYALPTFWIIVPQPAQLDPEDYLEPSDTTNQGFQHGRTTTDPLARRFLRVGSARDSVVSCSVLGGELLAARRVIRDNERDTPSYLMLPGGPDLIAERRPDAEIRIADLIIKLTDLEAESGSRLFGAQADIEIWRNHLAVYNAVAIRGAFLLDAISTHLAIHRRRKLFKRTHKSIELLHQYLVQAVADLDIIANLARKSAADIDMAAARQQDEYNKYITERHTARESGVRSALTETGLFERARRQTEDVLAEADRVKTTYRDILQVIGSIFDQRRAREADRLQNAGVVLAALFGILGLVTVFDATIDMKPALSDPKFPTIIGLPGYMAKTSVWASFLIGAGLLVGTVIVLKKASWLDRLGSRQFRSAYAGRRIQRGSRRIRRPGVWHTLLDTSTDTLERNALTDNTDWDSLDHQLADNFATCWDTVTGLEPPHRHRDAAKDIDALGRQVEQWGMHALLLTERARRMYRYRLPNLICLYRCTGKIDQSFLQLAYIDPVNMMADTDFERSLERLGFSWKQIRRIDHYLTGSVNYESARQAFEAVKRLSLRGEMDEAARERAAQAAKGASGPSVNGPTRSAPRPSAA